MTETHTPVQSIPKRWLAFSAALVASVMDLLDSTITQVAAPSIRADLGGSYTTMEWVTAAYTLAMAVVLLTGGRLGDLFGRKRMLLIGAGAFVVTSAACALVTSPGELIAGRAVQGAFAALMLPQVFGLIRDLFGPKEMVKAFSVFGPVMGLSAMLGPIVSGALIDADIFGTGWRMIFLINIPIGAYVLLTGHRFLPTIRAEAHGGQLDIAGAVLAGVSMFLLVFPLVEGRELGWPMWTIAMLIGSVPVFGIFARYQVNRKRSQATPLIEPSVFTRRPFVSGIGFTLFFIGAMGGSVFIFNVLLQAGLGFTPWQSALATAPWAAGGFIGSAISGMTMQKLGRKIMQIGLAVQAVGLLAFYLVLRNAGVELGALDMTLPLLIGGIGMGMVFVPLFDIVLAGVEPQEMGSASGILHSANGLAMSIGIAGIGTAFFSLVGDRIIDAHNFVHAGEVTILITIGLLTAAFASAFWMPRQLGGQGNDASITNIEVPNNEGIALEVEPSVA